MSKNAKPQYGTEVVIMDHRSRITIPSRFRLSLPPQLALGLAVGKAEKRQYLTVGPPETCPGIIYEYPVKLDAQGRLLIPRILTQRVGLSPGGKTVVLKREQRMEIWNLEAEIAEFLYATSVSTS